MRWKLRIDFEKWHGNGNDFVIVNSVENKLKVKKDFIRKASNRNEGVGFDQLIKLCIPTKETHDFFVKFFNADGSEANMCLNGIRCVASYVWRNSFAPQKKISFMTKAGIVECFPSKQSKVSVYIKNPVDISNPHLQRVLTNKSKQPFNLLNIGNNHLCIKMKSISKVDLAKIYKELPKSAKDIEINLSIYKKEKNKISIRTYENGVGETLSCGSASLSVASIFINKAKGPIEVSSFGGKLNFRKYNDGILMAGPTSFIFKGNIDG